MRLSFRDQPYGPCDFDEPEEMQADDDAPPKRMIVAAWAFVAVCFGVGWWLR